MAWLMTLKLDEQIYPLRVVQRMAYSLASDFCIQVRQENAQWVVEVTPNNSSSLLGGTADTARAWVLRQLNDFALRDQIALETGGLRELLAGIALKECSH